MFDTIFIIKGIIKISILFNDLDVLETTITETKYLMLDVITKILFGLITIR